MMRTRQSVGLVWICFQKHIVRLRARLSDARVGPPRLDGVWSWFACRLDKSGSLRPIMCVMLRSIAIAACFRRYFRTLRYGTLIRHVFDPTTSAAAASGRAIYPPLALVFLVPLLVMLDTVGSYLRSGVGLALGCSWFLAAGGSVKRKEAETGRVRFTPEFSMDGSRAVGVK